MKIQSVVANNRRRAFEVHTRRDTFVFPYAKDEADPLGRRSDRRGLRGPRARTRRVYTTGLPQGRRALCISIPVLEDTVDPAYMAELTVYRLTLEAKERYESSGLSAREVARLLDTSPTQLYRLLDPTNYTKSLKQLVSLLYLLGGEVEVEVRSRSRRRAS